MLWKVGSCSNIYNACPQILNELLFCFLQSTHPTIVKIGKSFEDYKLKIQADLKTAVMGSWAVWVSYIFLLSL